MRPCLNLFKAPIRPCSIVLLVTCIFAAAIGTFLSTRTPVSRVHAASTGLVAAYAFNEGSGTIVTDSSGNGNNGTTSGATWTTAGKFGGALSFNGTSSRVAISDSASLHLSTGMTLEAWVSPSSVPTNWQDVVYKENDIYFLEAGSGVTNNPPAVGATFASHGNQFMPGVSALAAKTWTHLAATYDSATLRLYVNGVQVASRSISDSLTSSTKALQIGGDAAFGQYFRGIIDEVRVYNRALSTSEIQNDMITPVSQSLDTQPPTAPSNLIGATSGSTGINLSWTASTDNIGVTNYLLERCVGSGCTSFSQIATPTSTSYSDAGLSASTSYSYRVRATDAAGNLSGYSNIPTVLTPAASDTTSPSAPANLTATPVSTSQINLSWSASTDNVGVTGYRLERCLGSGCTSFSQIATPTGPTYSDTGLTASTPYSYRVSATDAAGNISGFSNTVSVVTLAAQGNPPAIAFVQAKYATPHPSQSVVTVTFSAAQTAGDLNVAVVGWNDTSATVSSVSDTSGNLYTLAIGPTRVSGAITQSIYYAKNILAAAANSNVLTVRFSASAISPDIRILEYKGLDPASPLDVASAATGNNSTSASPSAVTSNANDLIVGANIVVSSTNGPGTGFTQRLLTSPDGDIAEDRIVSATGSYSATAPLSSPAAWIMQMVAFKATAAGSADPPPPTLTSISVSPANPSIIQGSTQQFTATGTFSNDSTQDVTTSATWNSSNTSVATIGATTGLANGVNAGMSQITATMNGVASPAATLNVTSSSGGGGSAQVDLVQHLSSSNTRNNSFTSPYCYHFQLPNYTTAGNAVVVGFTFNGNSTPTVSDDKGDSYTTQVNFYDSAHTQSVGIATAFNVAAGARVISVCFSSDPGGYVQPMATEFDNVIGIDSTGSGSAGTGTSVTAGMMTPTTNGDLVYQVAFSLSVNQSSFTAGSQSNISWNLLSADLMDGFAAQYGLYSSTAPLNATLAMGTSQNWVSAAVLLKTGTTGGVPAGMRIVHLVHENLPDHSGAGGTETPFANPTSLQFPSSGNLLVAMIGGGNLAATVTGIGDTNHNAWSQAGATQIQAGNDVVQTYYAANSATSGSLKLTVSWSATNGDFTLFLYDVAGAATSPLDTTGGATGSQSNAGNLTMPFTISPAGAGELLFAEVIWDFNTGSGLLGQGWFFDTNTFSGESQSGPEPIDENNGWGHYVTTGTAPVSITWQTMYSGLATGNWAGMAAAFKPAGSSSSPPQAISVSISPTSASVLTGQSQSFTAIVQNDGTNAGVVWNLSGTGCSGSTCGALSNSTKTSVTYTAPASVPSTATVTLLATSASDGTKSASATITVTQQSGTITVAVSPRRSSVTLSQPQQFSATVTGDSQNLGVTWAVDGTTGGNSTSGTISAQGLYTPGTVPGLHNITAVSVANGSSSASASVAVTDLAGVLTYQNDSQRTGQNLQEYALTASTVNTTTFGQLFSCSVTENGTVPGQIYAQPLYVANLTMADGKKHNVLFVVTQSDFVYAFDADANPCQQLWKASMLSTSHAATSGETTVPAADTGEPNDINPEIGITSTPVIDLTTNTIYVCAKSKDASSIYHLRLHALDLVSGNEKSASSPVAIAASGFVPLIQAQRMALLLNGNSVYFGSGSHGDMNAYHGWLIGYDKTSLVQKFAWASTDLSVTSTRGGIWQAGAGPAVDLAGNIWVETANGDFDGSVSFGDSVVRLNPSAVAPASPVVDFFAPQDQLTLLSNDIDLGSGGVTILPDGLGSSTHPHLALATGKTNLLYLLDQNNLGHFNSGGDNVVQEVTLPNGLNETTVMGGMFSKAAYFNGRIYVVPIHDVLRAFSISNATLSAVSSTGADQFGFPGATPSISAQGTSNGIVWALNTTNNNSNNGSGTAGPAVLFAYDATSLAKLYNSPSSGSGAAATAVKFTVPTVANGKVYVAGEGQLTVFGLLP